MVKPTRRQGYDSFVRALIQFSGHAQAGQKSIDGLLSKPLSDQAALTVIPFETAAVADYETPTLLGGTLASHAEPLAPLKQRDEVALVELFTHDKIEEIAEEVQTRLNSLYPEPCWDDEPFEFLQRYL